MQLTLIPEKRCWRCKETKALTEFYRLHRTKDGHAEECKACCKARSHLRVERRTKESRSAYKKEYGSRPEVLARSAAKRRARPEDHPTRAGDSERVKRWRAQNPEKRALEVLRERARRSVGRDAAAVEYALHLRCDPCSYCGGPATEVDHIVPVARGGGNMWENLTAACRRCNPSKNDTSLLLYLLQRRAVT